MNRCVQIKGRFVNPHQEKNYRSLWDFFLWRAGYYNDEIAISKAPDNFSYPGRAKPFDPSLPSAVWIGHSTYLIDTKECTILTDPVLSSYCSPVPIRKLRRRAPPALTLQDLANVQIVLISHNHYDHLDAQTVKALHKRNPNILWIVPSGVKKWFTRRGIYRVVELQWGEEHQEGNTLIAAVSAQHFSGRTLLDKDRTLWNGYVIKTNGKTLYFVGDTGYNPFDFKEIGKKFGPIDLSLIPIGSYLPKRFMSPVHCSPFEGVQIHLDVQSRLSLGMHWNTFCLSDEPFDLPPYDLYLAMKANNLPFDTFLPQEMGLYINW